MSWVHVAIWVATLVVGYALRPKPPGPQPPATFDQVQVPTAEEGGVITVAFGTVPIKNGNVVWYGDFKSRAIRASGGKK